MSSTDLVTKVKVNPGLSEPPMYKVVYLNDNITSMEFVIDSLIDIFNYNPETAVQITQDIHENGSATVAVMPFEIAEQKGIEVTVCAKAQKYPLQVRLEPEFE